MDHLRTRNDVIEWLEVHAPYPSIRRAILDNHEFLGGFSNIPPLWVPGWVVKVTSKHRRTWYIAVLVDLRIAKTGYLVMIIKNIPWRYWIGDISDNQLYQGDYPKKYKLLRDKELENV